MYVSLVEYSHVASDLNTRAALRDMIVLETAEATDKSVKRMHGRRLKALAEGRDVQLVRTAAAWEDPRRENPRRRRRAFDRAMRRVMRRVAVPQAKRQARVDAEVDKEFAQRERQGGRRRASGLVVPNARGR